jgi:zinc metalloprotease ZmpA
MIRKLLTAVCVCLCAVTLVLAQSNQASQTAVQKAADHLAASYRAYGLSNPGAELKLRSAKAGVSGTAHMRYDQHYKGVPVFEGEAIVHVDAAGEISVTNALRGGLNLDVKPGIPAAAAIASVRMLFNLRGPIQEQKATLEILPRGERSNIDLLAWHVQIFFESEEDGTGSYDVFVDAASGNPVWGFDSLQTGDITGTGNTMYLGSQQLRLDFVSGVYYMRDMTRAGSKTTDMLNRQSGTGTIFSKTTAAFGNGVKDSSDRSTAGTDAHVGMVKTWEYFANTHGRNGIDGNGRSTYSRVHYGRNYENAFWSDSCFCMTYGDGASTFYPLVALDVAGHEMAHGVMSREANLTYSGESGGLNESSSDIFGTLVEAYVNSPADVPDYWIGERIYKSNWSNSGTVYTQSKALRYMDDPAKDGISPACWSSTLGSLNVHYSSGPNNHMFYLLAHGGISKCNGQAVTGIGNERAAKIWYKAISDYMTASTNYAGARTACLASAAALYGNGSTEYSAVNAAYAAIGVK